MPVEFPAKHEEVKEWLPETFNSFMEELRSSKTKSAKKREDKIKWFVSWSFLSKKPKTEEEKIEKQMYMESKTHLTYDERVKEDLPKIKMTVYMKAGFYERSDRSLDKEVPKIVIDMAHEIIKITMLKEQIFVNDENVKESIKEWKYLLRDIVELDENDDPILDENGKPMPVLPFEVDKNGLPKINPETGMPIMRKKKGTGDNEKKEKETPLTMDDILDKINDSGMSSLSARELQFLEKMSHG